MTKYLLGDWERNGRDESDFYLVAWNTETEAFEVSEWASTRYSCSLAISDEYQKEVPADVLRDARKALARRLYSQWKGLAERDHYEPNNAERGDVLEVTTEHKGRGKPPVPAGARGEVFWCGAFGTFYRNGYNQPGRDNRRVGLRLLDGSKVFVPLAKCRRAGALNLSKVARRAVANARKATTGERGGGEFWHFFTASYALALVGR